MTTPEIETDPRIVSLPAAEIRRRFVEFFAERGHEVVPSASLVPAGDQTLLFTNSGMVQFKDVFTGAETRSYRRAVDHQRCLRVAGKHNDFEEVGRTPRHHTFFEMLGNWSFGDYFKREAIHYAWDFLTRDLGIPPDRLAATTYKDDEVARVLRQVPTNYDTDLFMPIHERMRALIGHDPAEFEAERFSYQVIADHARAVTFLVADGVLPSNEGRGYVLRKLVRRAVRHGRLLGRTEPFLADLATVVIDLMVDAYPYLADRREDVLA